MKSYRALVVEDDEDLGTIFSTALRSMEFAEVVLIADGAKALAWLAEHEPDLVVLDLHLPKLSGVNLLRQITQEMRLLNTRVMVVTADTDMAEELRNKADLVLVKPVTFTQIRELAGRLVPGAAVKKIESHPPSTAVEKPSELPLPASPPAAAPPASNPENVPLTSTSVPADSNPPASNPAAPPLTPPSPAAPADAKEPAGNDPGKKDAPSAEKS